MNRPPGGVGGVLAAELVTLDGPLVWNIVAEGVVIDDGPFALVRRRLGDMMTEGRLGWTSTGGWGEFEPKQD